jgi:hypothetical protein
MVESNLNTIFEQDGKVYAICSHKVPSMDLAKFISTELRHSVKFPRAQMRIVTTEEFKSMPFGCPDYPAKKKTTKRSIQDTMELNI